MLLETLARLEKNETRLREIFVVLGKHGLTELLVSTSRAPWLRKYCVTRNGQRLDQFTRAERFRLALLELGTTFVKLGQMLSTRPDLIGAELAAELSKLLSSTPADPIATVRRTIETQFGKPPEELFEEFSPVVLASASIAQVHCARLRGGEAVAVKIQHDGIEATIHRDLDLMGGLAEIIQKHVPALRNYRPVNIVREFRRTLLRELDLNVERRNLEEFARRFSDDHSIHFPKVYPELCGRRVLTMELLDGTLGSDVDKTGVGADLSQFVRRAATMYLNMIFRDGFYHADPHPGNYVVLPDSVVGMLDCGMVGRLDEELREEIEGSVLAVAGRDPEELAERIIRLGSPPADLDRRALQADLSAFVADYASQPIKDLKLNLALRDMTDIIARFRIVLPTDVSLLLRTLVVLEGSAQQLDPSFSLMDLIVEYQTRFGVSRLQPGRWWRDIRRLGRGYDRLIRALPSDMADILHRLRCGKFEVKHDHRRLQESIHRLVEGLLAGALLLSSALLVNRGNAIPAAMPAAIFFFLFGIYLSHRVLHRINAAERDRLE